jgi:lysophospholipase L1-like esterase
VAKGEAYRILGIGDSFAVGVVPYEDNYLTLVEEELRRSGWDVELINMGIPNIGPKEYLALLTAEGLELDPDLVLLSFFAGNDFLESVRVVERSAVDYSYVASLLRYAFVIRPHLEKKIPEGPWEYDDASPSMKPEIFLKIERRRSRICFQSSESFTILLDAAVDKLGEISKICRRRGIALVVVVIPDEFQVNQTLQDSILKSRRKRREGLAVDFARPNRMLARELDALGIEYLDLLPAFADTGRQTRYYKLRDTHWNIAGNQLAAELIAEHLISRRPPR